MRHGAAPDITVEVLILRIQELTLEGLQKKIANARGQAPLQDGAEVAVSLNFREARMLHRLCTSALAQVKLGERIE